MKVTVKFEGGKALDEALGELTKATGRNVLRKVLMRAGQPMADTASALAPDDPNTGAPDLHTSITVSTKVKNTTGNAEYREVLQNFGSKEEAVGAMRDARRAAAGEGSFADVYVGPDVKQFHAHLQEFGTINHSPQPFMRPAFDQQKGRVLEIIASDLGAEIEKAAKRARRKAAKLAAMGA